MSKYFEEKNQEDVLLRKALEKYNSTPIEREAAIFDRNVSNKMNDTVFLGSGLKSELAEIERHLIKMVSEGIYSYKYIQNYLLSIGYQPARIKEVFRKITGMNPDDLVDPKEYYDSPSSIPGLTHAWGEAKENKKHDYFFINAYNNGYAIFGQKGDFVREVIELFVSLKQALKAMKSMVKEVYSYDNVVDQEILLKEKDLDRVELSGDVHIPVTAKEDPINFFRKAFIYEQISEDTFNEQISNLVVEGSLEEEDAIELINWKDNYKIAKNEIGKIEIIAELKLKRMMDGKEEEFLIEPVYNIDNDTIEKYFIYNKGSKLTEIKNANEDGKPMSRAQLDNELYNIISEKSHIFASFEKEADEIDLIEKDLIKEKEEEIKKIPIENEMSGRTPEDFFDKNIKEGKEIGNLENLKQALESLNKAKEIISDYEIKVHSYEYYNLPSEIEDELKGKINSEDIETFFSSNSVISIILEIESKELGEEFQKKVLAVFTSRDNKVSWDGIVKGEDKNFYAFSNEGMDKLFQREIQSIQEKKNEMI